MSAVLNTRFPGLLQPIPENIPDELKSRNCWIVWQTEYDHELNKWTKIPRIPKKPKIGASKNNPAHFSDFDTAYQSYLANDFLGGIGFVLTPDCGLVFYDLDKCIIDGEINQQARDIIDSVYSYTEYSPSGKGIRIICFGKLPGSQFNNRQLGIELYDGQKNSFLTISGHCCTEQLDIVDAQKEINSHYYQFKPSSSTESLPATYSTEFIDNVDLSRLNKKTLSLINGVGWDKYPSRSEVLYGACLDMLNARYSQDEILSVLTDDNYAIAQVAESRRPNNRESQRVWIANYTLSKALSVHSGRTEVDFSEIIIKQPEEKAPLSNSSHSPKFFPVPILNELMHWMESTSDQPTRMITMQGVIALTAVLAGRIYKSSNSNDSSLFLMTLAPTGYGKAYPEKAINALFTHAKLNNLIKGGGNTSTSGVFSALRESPCHIQISDEIGKQYQTARKQQNGMMAEGFTQLTKCYSLTDSVMHPRNFSTEGMTQAQLSQRGNRFIINPSCTLFSFATFEQVFNNLTTSEIDDGFLNRQIIVNVDEDQLPEQERRPNKPPQNLIDWAKAMRGYSASKTTLEGIDTAYDQEPNYIIVEIDPYAKALFKKFKSEIKELTGDHLKIAIRWNENAMRMATGFAVAANQSVPVINEEIAKWCINYVRFHGERFIALAEQNIADNEFHRFRNQIHQSLIVAGSNGRTEREFSQSCRLWKGMTPQQKEQALGSLIREELVIEVKPEKKQGKGRRPIYSTYYLSEFVDFLD